MPKSFGLSNQPHGEYQDRREPVDLDLGPGVALRRGRKAEPVDFTIERPLDEQDLAALATQEVGASTPPIKALRETHHYLARLLAQGMAQGAAGRLAGFSDSRVSILRKDPAFSDLVARYSSQVEEVFVDQLGQMARLSNHALGELQERLDSLPDSFTNAELRALFTTLSDRSGHGPSSTVRNETGLSPEDVAEIKQAVVDGQAGTVRRRPSEYVDAEILAAGPGTERPLDPAALLDPPSKEPPGGEGEGENL